ncbi:hypothetical protein BC833DRAFT_571721 [Globomyces pollinis-pini]|nr:hypothetical protein BC833DRAFT_571721 [Globomyces pollinis-pini]
MDRDISDSESSDSIKDVSMSRRQSIALTPITTQPDPKTPNSNARRMSLDVNWKTPTPKCGLNRIRSQLLKETQPLTQEVEFERKINTSIIELSPPEPVEEEDQPMVSPMVSPLPALASQLTYLSTSRLNPENTFPSRLREEMRLPQSPNAMKRKLSSASDVTEKGSPELGFNRPLKRIFRSNSRYTPPNLHLHRRTNSGSSIASDMTNSLVSPNMEPQSPKTIALQGMVPLNLGTAGTDFSKMTLS